jgi:signal transduction histidine kinase
VNGFNAFFPERIKDNPYVPPVVLTDFQIFNQSVPIGQDSPLPQSISEVEEIVLPSQDKVFSFEFATLNYIIPEKNQYAYMMEGFDEDWMYSGNRRFVTYTNLDPGTYTFKVKGSNNDGVWNETGVSVKVIVTPPFWETTWFRASVLLVIATIIVGTYYLRVNAIKKQQQRLEMQVAERTKELSDRTEQLAQSNEELAIAKERAEVANQAKSTFLTTMSHELRSPLNAILGFAQLMTHSSTLIPQDKENLGIISRSGEHLLNLINDVLDMSKIEAGRTTLNQKNFDLHRLLADVEDMFRLKADDKGIQLLFECTSDVPQYVRTDEGKLRQVLINLLSNALKFTEEGGVTLRVSRGAEEQESRGGESFTPAPPHPCPLLYFEVQDTGPGMTPDEIDTIFEAFVQTETGRQSQEGTGLGLPISRKFVQLMGGDMQVKSPPSVPTTGGEVRGGQGTTFKFDIQVSIVEAGEVVEQTVGLSRRVIALAPDQPRYRILIVDDRWDNRRLLIKLLTDVGPPPLGPSTSSGQGFERD